MTQKITAAESFAMDKHGSMTRSDGITPYFDHLQGVVNRLKNIGVSDEEILAAAWLHDTIEDTNTTFDEIDQRFGSRIAVLVLSLSKDKRLPKDQREKQYVKQLKDSSLETKLIKLCDISSNLKDLKNAPWSRTKKTKEIKKKMYYLNVIKPDLIKNKLQIPGIQGIVDGINEVIGSYGQRLIII
jgi:guanosine-3',5'-bis(diphosphate) 3'-pyrophosphohydrolase